MNQESIPGIKMISRILKSFSKSENGLKLEDIAIFKAPKAAIFFEPDEALILEADWESMSLFEQRDFYAENGFLVVREAIEKNQLEKIHSEIRSLGLNGTTEDIWGAPSLLCLIENDKVVGPLRSILGQDICFFKGAYVQKPPLEETGAKPRREALHVDYGVGERVGDFRNSCASWINVGYYLTELSARHAPFWVVPGSNRWHHFIPETDMEDVKDQARMLLAKPGDAILFHCLTVHATSHNVSNNPRQALFFSYRPAWARPIGPVPEWPQKFIDSAPPERREMLWGLNKGLDYKFK